MVSEKGNLKMKASPKLSISHLNGGKRKGRKAAICYHAAAR